MIDLTHKWCTYRSSHQSSFFYEGKGQTAKVNDGSYKGSGIKFHLSLTTDEFAWDTWTTVILETFTTEQEAYDAEALLVSIQSLANPWRLNMTAGGSKGKYMGHGALYKRINSAKRAATKKEKAAKSKAKIAALKQKLKEEKNGTKTTPTKPRLPKVDL